LREIGAAVSLSANGSRELERLGCLDAIEALSAEPTEFVWRDWRDDRRVAAFPVAPWVGPTEIASVRNPKEIRSALRGESPTAVRDFGTGFRVARTLIVP
jgi:2-polyprenyl-6-methoxyphenol hydroxylase-like FAD-dependent oxidoreductase